MGDKNYGHGKFSDEILCSKKLFLINNKVSFSKHVNRTLQFKQRFLNHLMVS